MLGALAVAGCGGAGHLEGHVFHGAETTYRVGHLGPDWRPLDVEDQNDLAFSDERTDAVVQVNSSCDPDLDIPLESLTRHLLIGFTDRQIRSQKRVPMDAREALRTHVVAKLDGVPREMLLYVLKKNECVYDFALVAPPGERYARARDAYEAFIAGFHTEGGSVR